MTKTFIAIIKVFPIAYFLVAACCFADKIKIESDFCNALKINDLTLLVLSPDNHPEPIWFVVSQWKTTILKNPPPTMHDVLSLKASSDNKHLAVLSVGEGHPVIDIFGLPEVLDDKKPNFLFGVDPYPGTVNIVEWKGNYLHIKSDMLLTHINKDDGRVPSALTLFSSESFRLNVNTGIIEPVLEILKRPTAYYGKHLLENPDEYSPIVELSAIEVLNNKEAIPYLKQALKISKHKKYKTDIFEVLKKLEKTYNKANSSADAKSRAAD